MSTLKIAIIGAGPAGCMLARLLHLAGIEAVVFEGEASPNYRSQGGTLDLHTTTGLAALKAAGLWDGFLKHARYDGQYMAIVDKDVRYYMRRSATNKAANAMEERPEIDRAELRRLLTESLPDGAIRWGHHLQRVEDDNTLVFDHATVSEGFDLVVGADGAWSKVRRFIDPDAKPAYTRIGHFELSIPDAATTAPDVYELVNRGSVFAYAEGKKISIQQMGDGSIQTQVNSIRDDEDWAAPDKCGYDACDIDQVRPALLAEFADWSPRLTAAITHAAGPCTPRSLYMLPVGYRWAHRAGATLIGDAAHLMTPFAGEGVNVAFQDALELSRAIAAAAKEAEARQALDRHVEAFEKVMFPRMEKVQRLTDGVTHDFMWTPGSPKTSVASAIARHVKYHTPTLLQPLASVAVHAFFFVQGLRH